MESNELTKKQMEEILVTVLAKYTILLSLVYFVGMCCFGYMLSYILAFIVKVIQKHLWPFARERYASFKARKASCQDTRPGRQQQQATAATVIELGLTSGENEDRYIKLN